MEKEKKRCYKKIEEKTSEGENVIKNDKTPQDNMKRGYMLLCCIVLLVLTGCLENKGNREYTFAEGFSDLATIDKEFNASFKEERLYFAMVPLEKIDPLMEKVEERKKKVQAAKESQEREALLQFIEIRKLMLLAQRNFHLAEKIGDIGLVTDKGGYKCAEAKYILDAAYYYNESWSYARQAQLKLDDLLYEQREVPRLQHLVGLNENKTAFYKSPLDNLKEITRLNHEALEKNCKIQVVTK